MYDAIDALFHMR